MTDLKFGKVITGIRLLRTQKFQKIGCSIYGDMTSENSLFHGRLLTRIITGVPLFTPKIGFNDAKITSYDQKWFSDPKLCPPPQHTSAVFIKKKNFHVANFSPTSRLKNDCSQIDFAKILS